MLAVKAAQLRADRHAEVAKLDSLLKDVYRIVSPDEEFPELIYKPDTDAVTENDFLDLFHKNRARDRLMKSTQQGPHRDDILVRIQSRKARDYASEGQQRSLIISLKIAQLQYLHQVSGVQPVLLADDVLGELDHDRKLNFWEAVGDSIQVIATGTVVPTTDTRGRWQVFDVNNGNFTELSRL
jgi:DNA replication and repair protein RecF